MYFILERLLRILNLYNVFIFDIVEVIKMLLRTHLMFGILVMLLLLTYVEHKLAFAIMVLVATAVPDFDNKKSSWGRHIIFRPGQFFTKHRGMIHSFTTAVVLSVIIAVFWPVLSLGFFVGFSVHLITDSFTKSGIKPFWPLKVKSCGPLHTGGRSEEVMFLFLIVVNIILFFVLFL